MANNWLYRALNITDSTRYVANLNGQDVLDATNAILASYNDTLAGLMGLWVEETTAIYSETYKLPGGGTMQETGPNTVPYSVTAGTEYSVNYPLRNWTDRIVRDDIADRYLTAADFQRNVNTIFIRDANTVALALMEALFRASSVTVRDGTGRGDLTIHPLANGDSVLYPPAYGSTAPATADHVTESGYAASAIDDTHDPVATLGALLRAQRGFPTGGNNFAFFYNGAQDAKLKALAPFVDIADTRVRVGSGSDTVNPGDIPAELLPQGRTWQVTGVYEGMGWMVRWDRIPANYIIARDLDTPAPLKERIDDPAVGIPQGLHLVGANPTEITHIFRSTMWRHRFGFGVGNRLGAAVMQLAASGSYAAPTLTP